MKKFSKIISGMLLITTIFYVVPVLAYTKDETVYSKLNTNGNRYKTIVSTHLTNTENEDLINDMTNLVNIINSNGDETFKQDNNYIVWNSQKNDIYYQGETEKELPVEMSVKYELDGKEMEAQEIVGKSGNVVITLTYTNKDVHDIKIDGKTEKLYTPFVVCAGTSIDNRDNKNIKITNGKVIDDGSKSMVIGMTLPGLRESLGVSNIPNSIKISMDTTNFKMNSIISFVTPKVFEQDDTTIFDNLKKVYNQVEMLSSSSKMLQDGANQLKDGTKEYSDNIKEFEEAMTTVSEGMSTVNYNYTKINEGIKVLSASSNDLNSGAEQISYGIEQVGANLNAINEKLGELLEGSQNLESGEAEIINGIDKILEQLDKIPLIDNSAKITELDKLVKANKDTINSLTNANSLLQAQYDNIENEEQKASIYSQINTNNSIIELLKTNVSAENEIIESLKSTDGLAMAHLKEGLNEIKNGLNKLNYGTNNLSTGISTIKTGTATLAQKTEELSVGTNKLYQGTNQLFTATKTLKEGSGEIKKGLNTLDNSGANLLKANSQLVYGAKTINDGATNLAEGIDTFNREGIDKICSYVNVNIRGVTNRFEKLVDLSSKYNNFTMLNEGANGNVKFINIVEPVK